MPKTLSAAEQQEYERLAQQAWRLFTQMRDEPSSFQRERLWEQLIDVEEKRRLIVS